LRFLLGNGLSQTRRLPTLPVVATAAMPDGSRTLHSVTSDEWVAAVPPLQPHHPSLAAMQPYLTRTRPSPISIWLLGLAILPLLLQLGCSSVKERRAAGGTLKVENTSATVPASNSSDDAVPVQPVSYQTQKYGGEIFNDPNCIASPIVTHVDSDQLEGMTLEALDQLAMQNNPAIQQAAAMANKAAAIQWQVGVKPNPTLGYYAQEIGNESASGIHGAFLSQTFIRGNKLEWNRAVHGHDVQFTRWLAEIQRVRVRNDIRLKFYEALGAQKRLELAKRFHIVAEKGVEATRELVAAQEGARADILQSEVQLGEIDLAIQQTQIEFDAAWQELVAIAGVPELPSTNLVGELTIEAPHEHDVESLYLQLELESPLLAAACTQVRRAHANLQRQRVQPISNLNAQVGAGYDDTTGDEFASVQLSMPIPVHNKNQGNICAAHAEYVAATQNVQRLKMKLRQDLAKVLRSYNMAQASVKQLETLILPNVGQTLEIMQTAQALGEFNFLRVFTARRAYFDANLKYVTALTELAKANASLQGLLLTGGLEGVSSYEGSDGLRGAALSGQ